MEGVCLFSVVVNCLIWHLLIFPMRFFFSYVLGACGIIRVSLTVFKIHD